MHRRRYDEDNSQNDAQQDDAQQVIGEQVSSLRKRPRKGSTTQAESFEPVLNMGDDRWPLKPEHFEHLLSKDPAETLADIRILDPPRAQRLRTT